MRADALYSKTHALPMDQWTGRMGLPPWLKACEAGRLPDNASTYAERMISHQKRGCRKRGGTLLQPLKQFLCRWPFEHALDGQKALWKRKDELKPLCGTRQFLYNQVGANVRASSILGVFIAPSPSDSEAQAYARMAAEAVGSVPIVRLPTLFASPSQCLSLQPAEATLTYLRRVYGSVTEAERLAWRWEMADVIWLDALPVSTRECILTPRTPGVWTVHTAQGFYLPPIGSKMEHPVVWQYREELGCAGDRVEYGGQRTGPRFHAGRWMEVFHYFRPSYSDGYEASNLWLYQARGSGVWYWTGNTIVFDDTIDLLLYMRQREHPSMGQSMNNSSAMETRKNPPDSNKLLRSKVSLNKASLFRRATKLLRSEFDTIILEKHVDAGFQHSKACEEPRAGWATNYFYLKEVIVLKHKPGPECPPLPLYSGPSNASAPRRPSACVCQQDALHRRWPSLPKDKAWQLGVLRCEADNRSSYNK